MRIFLIAVFVIWVDQATKLVVVQQMHLRQSIPLIGDWLKFTFTENPGMAFGLQVGPDGFVAMLAIAATFLVTWYLWNVRHGYRPYTASLALILGGAVGNIIDRMFYGVIFDYGPIFQGRVVDFIHVDIGYVAFPEIIPLLGGSYISLFPIWNVADMAIVGGVLGILLFQGAFHQDMEQRHHDATSDGEDEAAQSRVPHEEVHRGNNTSAASPELISSVDLGPEAYVADGDEEEVHRNRKGETDESDSLDENESQKTQGSEHQPEQPRSIPDNSDTL